MAETERELIRFEHDEENRDILFTGYDPVWQSDYLTVKDWVDDFGRTFTDVHFLNYTTGGYRQIYALTDSVAAESTGYQIQGKPGDIVTVSGAIIGDSVSGAVVNPMGIYLLMGNGNAGAPTNTDYEPRIGAGVVVLDYVVVDSDTPAGFDGAGFEFTTEIDAAGVEATNVYLMFTQLEQESSSPWRNGILNLSVEVSRLVGGDDPGGDDPGDDEDLPHHDALARVVARNIDAADDLDVIELATLHVQIVEGFVYGYTRGKGFSDDGVPERPLRNVIVMAASKLTYNPEQVSWFRSGEYSERPAQWQGWSLMDLAVLNQYRKRWA